MKQLQALTEKTTPINGSVNSCLITCDIFSPPSIIFFHKYHMPPPLTARISPIVRYSRHYLLSDPDPFFPVHFCRFAVLIYSIFIFRCFNRGCDLPCHFDPFFFEAFLIHDLRFILPDLMALFEKLKDPCIAFTPPHRISSCPELLLLTLIPPGYCLEYPVTRDRCSTLSLSQLGHSSRSPDATWKSSMHTVMSFVKAKYPTCVFFAMFIANSLRPCGSGAASPSQISRILPPSTIGRKSLKLDALRERYLCVWRDVRSIRVIDRKIPCF